MPLVLLFVLSLPACLALRPGVASPALRVCTTADSAVTRRALLFALPFATIAPPRAAHGAATGGGFVEGQFESVGGGPPRITGLAPLTKGEPSAAELNRLAVGYQRLQYLLKNWDAETTVCIKGCKGKYESCGCTRDPLVVQSYMGYKSMNDPLFRAGDLMLRASTLIANDADFEKYNDAMESWNSKAEAGNIMAYVSSWGEANPGGGQDEILRYLEKSRKEVVESANLLKTILDCLNVPITA